MKITNKKDFYQKSQEGLLGNTFRVWMSYDEYIQSGYKGLITLRYLIRDSGYFVPVVEYKDIDGILVDLIKKGANLNLFTFGEIPIKEKEYRLIQDELYYSDTGLVLEYTFNQGNLRHALQKNYIRAEGIKAKLLLEGLLDPNSYNDIFELLEKYDGAIIEFSTFAGYVGTLPNRNTIIWGVRNY